MRGAFLTQCKLPNMVPCQRGIKLLILHKKNTNASLLQRALQINLKVTGLALTGWDKEISRSALNRFLSNIPKVSTFFTVILNVLDPQNGKHKSLLPFAVTLLPVLAKKDIGLKMKWRVTRRMLLITKT